MRFRVISPTLYAMLLLSAGGLPLRAQEYPAVGASPRQLPAVVGRCPQQRQQASGGLRALAGGEAPAYLLAAVQLLRAPSAWSGIYHEVEECAGRAGDYDAIIWAVMEAPLQGPRGATYAFTIGQRIVLVRDDTTYLRHEMLHHILGVSGWHPRPLGPGKRYNIADLHPLPLFSLCAGEV